jgi:hypothetical protein
VKLFDQGGGFVVGQVKVRHEPDMGSLIAFMNLVERHQGGGQAAQGGAPKPDRREGEP